MIPGLDADIESILEAGNLAPSGENCQPWRFIVFGKTVELHLIPERDRSYYGWGQRASYMANGAVLENMVIAASAIGYASDISYFPESKDEFFVATINFMRSSEVVADVLAKQISVRTSNRKPYTRTPLEINEKESLLQVTKEVGYGRLAFVETKDAIQTLSRVGAANEEIMLSNEALHGFFFSHLNWTRAEDDEKKIGFYIKTLELPAPALLSFNLIRHWPIMRVLAGIGLHRMVGKQNAATYSASSAIGALIIENDSPRDYVMAGRALERTWLQATALGLSIQPMTGILFFKLKIDNGEGNVFSAAQQRQVEETYRIAQNLFNSERKRISFMFRIGRGQPPSARASRFKLSEVVTLR